MLQPLIISKCLFDPDNETPYAGKVVEVYAENDAELQRILDALTLLESAIDKAKKLGAN